VSALTPLERSVLDVLAQAERPLKQSAIAARAHARLNSWFRSVFPGLRRAGLIVRVEGPDDSGWWLASRPLPSGCHVRPA
jgi:hypothetical protein